MQTVASRIPLPSSSLYDPLTGVLTRDGFLKSLSGRFADPAKTGEPFGLIVVDIDHFGHLNRTLGTVFGDRVLRALGHRLNRGLPVRAITGRISGGRFALLAECHSDQHLAECGDALVRSIASELLHLDRNAYVTVSAGCAIAWPGQDNGNALIARAEQSLAQAKAKGRNRSVLYNPPHQPSLEFGPNIALGRSVVDAFQNDRLALVFQPVVDAKTSRTAFHECLLRIRSTDGSLIDAASWIPTAEDMGLIGCLDQWVLNQAAGILRERADVTLAVNVSGYTAGGTEWIGALAEIASKEPGIVSRLIVEITETAAVHDIGQTIEFVCRARELGVRIALDDFGAGYTAFSHLKDLPVHMVKIDARLTRKLQAEADSKRLLTALFRLAEGFGLETVAEGAETDADYTALRDGGASYIQGFFCGRPAPALPVT